MLHPRVSEVRTQIYLPQYLHAKVSLRAQKRGVSVASVIRDAIAKDIGDDRNYSSETAWQKFFSSAGIGKKGPSDVSSRSGEYWAQAIEEKLKRRRKL